MANSAGWANFRKALSIRDYATYQGGRFCSQVAAWSYKVAVGWIVWQLTGSVAWLGIFGVLDQAPAFIVMPLAGAITDRINQFRYLRVTQAMLLAHAVLL